MILSSILYDFSYKILPSLYEKSYKGYTTLLEMMTFPHFYIPTIISCNCYLPGGSGKDPYPSRRSDRHAILAVLLPQFARWIRQPSLSFTGNQAAPAAVVCRRRSGSFSDSSREPGYPHDPGWPPAVAIYQVDPAEIHILLGGQAGPQFWLFLCCDLLDGSGSLSYPSRGARLSLQLLPAGGDLAAFHVFHRRQTVYMIQTILLPQFAR